MFERVISRVYLRITHPDQAVVFTSADVDVNPQTQRLRALSSEKSPAFSKLDVKPTDLYWGFCSTKNVSSQLPPYDSRSSSSLQVP
jgi:hypothetical protein